MLKRRIKYLSKRIRREESFQLGLPFFVQNELDKSLQDWKYRYNNSPDQAVKLYESGYSDIHWHLIEPTTQFEDFKTDINSNYKLNNFSESYRVKIPHHFFELDLEFKSNNSNSIDWIDTHTDKELLEFKNQGYTKTQNSTNKAKQLVVREQIIQTLREIWAEFKLPPITIHIKHKNVHFVDSSPGIVEKAILELMSKAISESPSKIKEKIEEKYKFFSYYFDTMNYESIDVYERHSTDKKSGEKLIYLNDYRDPFCRYVKRINFQEDIGLEIKETLLLQTNKKSAMMSAPEFKDALVFRDMYENIEAIFHLCFKTNVIQNEKRIFMKTDSNQMIILKSIIKSSR